jgi:TolB-like protein/Tfp pilus assembly protein PilF
MTYPLPEKPSIAVLPFDNMTNDTKQEYIADGITENIITALSKVPEVFVIARNSVFTYKGRPVKIKQVSEELGVQYVLEGSIQHSDSRLRITAQLIDATEGHHLWAERFDRNLKDIFVIQDEVTLKILSALRVEFTHGEQERVQETTKSLEAWSYLVKGHSHFESFTKDDNAKAQELFERAVQVDPGYSYAWAMLGWTHWIDAAFGFSESSDESFKKAIEIAQKALELDDKLPDVHALLGGIHLFQRQYDKAIAEGQRAIALGPNIACNKALLARTMLFAGRSEEAIELVKSAMRLSPHYPSWYLESLAMAYGVIGEHEKAVASYEKLLDLRRNARGNMITPLLGLAGNCVILGREDDARAYAKEVLRISPDFSLEWFRKVNLFKNPSHLKPFLEALHKAGLPETPPLPLPDKPSIAVLPFVNMSGDPEQEYFSDGITEEIITALSKVPDLAVIARNSSFTYKGKSVSIPVVGRELGVRYVLEGSVRKSSNKVRVTAQLIDARTNNHLWAERYDRDLKDIFALQDEITMKILTAVRVELTEGEQARLYGKRARNLDSFMKVLEGRPYFYRFSRESNLQARQMFEEAIALEPENAHALTMLGWTYLMEVWFGSSESPSKAVEQVVELAQKALSLDDTIDSPHSLLAHVYLMKRQFEMAIAEAERAVALSPNGADAQAHLGMILNYAGRREAAIASLEKAMRLNPIPPNWYLFSLGEAYCLAGEHEEALAAYEQVLRGYPDDIRALIGSTATYSLLGREEEARAQAAQILRMEPKFSLESFVKTLPFKNKADAELLFDSLHKAGLK